MSIFDKLFRKKKIVHPPPKLVRKTHLPKKDLTEEDTRPIRIRQRRPLKSQPKLSEKKYTEEPTRKTIAVTQEKTALVLDVSMEDAEIDEVVDESFDVLFRAGEAIASSPVSSAEFELSAEEKARDHDEARTLFANIAVNYIRPVKQFIFELKKGSSSIEWLPVCLPAITSMLESLKTMHLYEEADVLHVFKTYLEELQKRNIRIIDAEYQRVALDLYNHLEDILPETFQLGDEGFQREGVIIFSLLKQIPGVGKVTIDKLFAAGLSTLEMLFLANAEDLARTTGVPLHLSKKICDKFKEYRNESETRPVDLNQTNVHDTLAALTDELHQKHKQYEELVLYSWNDPDFNNKKKTFRNSRQEVALKINILLAELGEVDLVEEIEKLPFDRKIDRLNHFISPAQKH